ncbi:autotransporter outer membrane beta-barrel domain-containing protein [bacterium]|nr:autotransporter outer membrane beta-barrel domain-containing protein [bacterium]
MKNWYRFVGIMVFISMVISAPAVSDTGVRLNVGLSHIAYGDYNDFIETVNKDLVPFGIELENLSWVPEVQGEVIYSPLPMMTVGFGVGMIYGSAELSSDLIGNFQHDVKAYPMTVTAYFKPSIPLMPVKPYVYAGAGMYYSKLTFSVNMDQLGAGWESTDLTKTGFGLHGGAGLEFSIAPMLSLQVGVQGRWAKIKGFKGTGTDIDGNKVDVFLISDDEVEVEIQGSTVTVPAYGPWDAVDKDKYDEGTLDLTGYGFIVGLKLSF